MSTVTGVTLILPLSAAKGEVDATIVKSLNRWLEERDFGPLVEVTPYSGGTKHPQCLVFLCGYHNFPGAEFAKMICAAKWQDPQKVVLVLQPDQGLTKIVRPND